MKRWNITGITGWQKRYPGTVSGVLLVGNLSSTLIDPACDAFIADVESQLRNRYGSLDRAEIRATKPLAAYEHYYRTFGQHYHVAMQIESIARKGKPMPRRLMPVEVVFAHELLNGVLTAIHDSDELEGAIKLDASDDGVPYLLYNSTETLTKPGDMYFADESGVLSSIVRGPANRAQVVDRTRNVMVTAYGVPDVHSEEIERHLESIWNTLVDLDPGAEKVQLTMLAANQS